MIESIITISIAGFLAGFILSMPIAGPISAIIASNALKGRLRYCNRVNIGASFADFTYVFLAVYGLSRLYSFYKPFIPYMYSIGAFLLLYLGYRIINTKIDIENFEDKSHIIKRTEKKERGAFYTGFMINFLNPTLFLGWFTSSFLVISFIASMGFHTGGLEVKIDQNLKEISDSKGENKDVSEVLEFKQLDRFQINKSKAIAEKPPEFPPYFHLIISLCYALFIAIGSITWFYLLTFIIVRYRQHINIRVLSSFVIILGILLCIFGLYFGYQAAGMFLQIRVLAFSECVRLLRFFVILN